jgi:HEXXH motif-containing protein
MAPATGPSQHVLSDAEVAALAQGSLDVTIVHKLTAAQAGKHRMLLECVRRGAFVMPHSDRALMDDALTLLSDVEAEHPQIVADLLALPQFGGWAACLLRTISGAGDAADSTPKTQFCVGLGYLATLAATAAV